MRLAFMFAVACCLAALPAGADDAGDIEGLKADVMTLDHAYAAGDAGTIRRMVTPDNVSITSRYRGAADPDRQIAAFIDTDRKHVDHSPIDVVLLSPDIALVTFEKSYEGTFKGAPLPSRVAVSEIWMRQDGGWLNRTYQETAIAP